MAGIKIPEQVRFVLIGTSHPGNIGAAARAMKTMGLSRLMLVEPGRYPCVEATARASGADDVLAGAQVCANLNEALRGCRLVFGTSARERSLAWPELSPKACAEQIRQLDGEAAILFGREHSGLSNEELECCHYMVRIPANPVYSSLNLAAAVQVLAYELRCAAEAPQSAPSDRETPATYEEMQRFYAHLKEAMIEFGFFDPAKPKRLIPRLHRLFNRARPDAAELNILRGILSAAQAAAKKRNEAP